MKNVDYESATADYKIRLAANKNIIWRLNASTHPVLYNELERYRGALGRRLVLLIEHIERYEKAPMFETTTGKLWHFVSFDRLAKLYGGSVETWHGIIVYSAALGLLERRKATGTSIKTALLRSVQRGIEHGKQAVSWYHIPAYTEAVLACAEATINQFRREGISRTKINKAALIEAIGNKRANSIIVDGRRLSQRQKSAEDSIVRQIKRIIEANGYACKEEVLEAAAQANGRDAQLWRPLLDRIWKNRNRRILQKAGAVYSKPRKDEKERWLLTDNSWIIRPP